MAEERSKKGQGAFWLKVSDDGSVEVAYSKLDGAAWYFSNARKAYDNYREMADWNPMAWNVCYHLEDFLPREAATS